MWIHGRRERRGRWFRHRHLQPSPARSRQPRFRRRTERRDACRRRAFALLVPSLYQRQRHRGVHDPAGPQRSVRHRRTGPSLVRSATDTRGICPHSPAGRVGGGLLERATLGPERLSARLREPAATFGTDYAEVRHSNLDVARVRTFFGSDHFKPTVLQNRQSFDFTGLKGRLLSSSYAPEEGHSNHLPMLARLAAIFEQHQTNGQVSFEYDLNVYTGQFGPG